jgi:hypothetical protein
MELAADYDRALRSDWRWQVYAGLAGEPALGPPGYLHRASAFANPIGPVTHHLLDAAHGTFGVVTAGVHNRRWKVEASIFNARQPDDSRVDLDLGPLESVSARLSFAPTERVALQVSGGRVRQRGTSTPPRPDSAGMRLTASATYHRPLGEGGSWATTAAYGVNDGDEIVAGRLYGVTSDGALLETSVTVADTHTIFGRVEVLGMPAHHLHAHEYVASVFAVGKAQAGYVRHLKGARGIVPGFGATVSFSVLPNELAPRYAGRVAQSAGVFLVIRAGRHEM